MNYSKSKVLLAIFILTITISLIIFPSEILTASKRGLTLWWTVVFPSLLPFFILSELLIVLGVVHFFGVLLEPLMRPLFRVPGVGAFVLTMGMASGFPSGAKYTVLLRQENKISKTEGERLLAFTNFSNPVFIFGAISAGFMNNPKIGIVLAFSHYVANLLVGFCMRFYKANESKTTNKIHQKSSIKVAITSMLEKQQQDTRPFGKMFGDAVVSSVQTLLLIGGFIIFFSVLYQTINILGVWITLTTLLEPVLQMINIPSSIVQPIFAGLLEITIGSQSVSNLSDVNLYIQCIIIGAILAFGGFSVQAQVASIVAQSDLSLKPFFMGRILQALFSIALTVVFFHPLYKVSTTTIVPAFANSQASSILFTYWENIQKIGPLITLGALLFSSIFLFYSVIKSKTT